MVLSKKHLLALVLMVLMLSVWSLFNAFETVGRPWFGFLPYENKIVGSFVKHDQLLYRDVILKINESSNGVMGMQHNQNAMISIMRSKTFLDVSVTAKNLSALDVLMFYAPLFFTGLVLLCLVMLAIIVSPMQAGLWVFSFYGLALSAYCLSVYDFHTTYELKHVLWSCASLIGALQIHLALIYPNVLLPQVWIKRILFASYVVGLFILYGFEKYFHQPLIYQSIELINVMFVSIGFLLLLLTMHLRTKSSNEEIKDQAKILFYCFLFGFGLVFLGFWLIYLDVLKMPMSFIAPLCSFFAFSIFYAMNKSNLFFVQRLKKELSDQVSTIRKKENELFHAHRLASVGLLASGVAHEIGNAINLVTGNLTFLENRFGQSNQDHLSKSESTQAIDLIKKGVARTMSMVEKLKNHSKPMDIGKNEKIKVSNVVNDACMLLKGHLPKRITLKVNVDESIHVNANASALTQILINLILNAIEAIKEGGLIEISAQTTSEHVDLQVKDNGVGIGQDQLSLIFDPFFTSKVSGTGLGLTVCRDLVKQMKGEIDVQSEKGVGTIFKILLPLS